MENQPLFKLESFEGPFDMLLKLISKNKLNIYDIKLSVLIDQYLEQIENFRRQEMEISSEFLEMASRLLYIKTVSLLPKHDEIEKLKEELTGELLEYQTCKEMAQELSLMTGGFDSFIKSPEPFEADKTYALVHRPEILFEAYSEAVGRGKRRLPPSTEPFKKIVAKKIVAVSSKIVFVLRNLVKSGSKKLTMLYSSAKNKSELVATFLAVLELCKSDRIKLSGDGSETEIKLNKEHKKR